MIKSSSFTVTEEQANNYLDHLFYTETINPDLVDVLDQTVILGLIRTFIKVKVELKYYEPKAGDEHHYRIFEHTAEGVETAYAVEDKIYRNGKEILNDIQWTNYKGVENMFLINVASPVELRVYDSQGNVTGLVNGKVKEEIPHSIYDAENKTVVIFNPSSSESYRYEVAGIEDPNEKTYGLIITSVENGQATTFTSSDIPIVPGEVHQYTIDWDVLFQGEQGTTLTIDLNGDGNPEETIKAGNTLDMGAKLESQIAITQMFYGGIDILNEVTQDIGDKQAPLLLSELKESQIDLEDYSSDGKLNPGQKKKLKMKFKFLETAGNEYQGKSINVNFKFLATQEEQ